MQVLVNNLRKAKGPGFLIVFLLLFLLQCSELENPVIEMRDVEETPVERLSLQTPRHFVSRSEPLELLLSGVQIIYSCSEITKFQIIQNDSGYLQPLVNERLPSSIDDCALNGPLGIDTQLVIDLKSYTFTDSNLYLTNSVGMAVSAALLTEKLYRDTLFGLELKDSSVSDVQIKESLIEYIDTVKIQCTERLNFGGFCLNSNRDSLNMRLNIYMGWEAIGGCTSDSAINLKDEYFQFLDAPGKDSCLYKLEQI